MSVHVLATIKLKDPAKFKDYMSQVPGTIQAHGGKLVCRGKVAKNLLNEADYHIAAVFEFPSQEAIDTWYSSDEYQALIPLRDASADGNILTLRPI